MHSNNRLKDIVIFVLSYDFYLNFIKKLQLERVKFRKKNQTLKYSCFMFDLDIDR